MNDPYYDLACFSMENDLDAETEQRFWEFYYLYGRVRYYSIRQYEKLGTILELRAFEIFWKAV